jgi:uncharacterized protein YukE
MAQETYMDIPAVDNIAKTFAQIGMTVKDASKTLEDLMVRFRDLGFGGKVGTAVYGKWSSQVKPEIDKLGAKMDEISTDINSAIKAFRDNDYSGSQHYVGGGKV